MAKALGVGGIFFKSPDPQKLSQWYAKWLGLTIESGAAVSVFQPRTMPQNGYVVWSPFEASTNYFLPSEKEFMVNLIVDNLGEALKQVQAGGAQLIGDVEASEYGRFGWFMDPDGNKIELWEPSNS